MSPCKPKDLREEQGGGLGERVGRRNLRAGSSICTKHSEMDRTDVGVTGCVSDLVLQMGVVPEVTSCVQRARLCNHSGHCPQQCPQPTSWPGVPGEC